MDKYPFCQVSPGRVLLETQTAVAIYDGFPVTEGHALVVPRRHIAGIYELPEPEQAEIWSAVGQVRHLIAGRFKPDGFNTGLNEVGRQDRPFYMPTSMSSPGGRVMSLIPEAA
jgi:diadenosine tetraphosphate (Ap4A) HIT family hydrolase